MGLRRFVSKVGGGIALWLASVVMNPSVAMSLEGCILRYYGESLVNIRVGEGVLGTGTILDQLGTVLTSAHVISSVSDQSVIEVFDSEDEVWKRATLEWSDPYADLALLRAGDLKERVRYPYISRNYELTNGSTLAALAFIASFAEESNVPTMRTTLNGLIINSEARDLWWVDFMTNEGNSGGPVFDDAGGLVGVVAGARAATRGVSRVVTGGTLRDFLLSAGYTSFNEEGVECENHDELCVEGQAGWYRIGRGSDVELDPPFRTTSHWTEDTFLLDKNCAHQWHLDNPGEETMATCEWNVDRQVSTMEELCGSVGLRCETVCDPNGNFVGERCEVLLGAARSEHGSRGIAPGSWAALCVDWGSER